MTNPNDPAFPLTNELITMEREPYGLTKREYFIGMTIQGFLAGGSNVQWTEKQFAIAAINVADALIAELSKEVKSE